jgi:hypothetical protein
MELITFSVIATNVLLIWELFCFGRMPRSHRMSGRGPRAGRRQPVRIRAPFRTLGLPSLLPV